MAFPAMSQGSSFSSVSEEFGHSEGCLEQATGSKTSLDMSPDHITLEITTSVEEDEDSSFSTQNSIWTEIHPSKRAESALEKWERVRQGGIKFYDRSNVRLGKKIGEGAQGTIYQASLDLPFIKNPRPVAVKKFRSLDGVSHGHHYRDLWKMDCASVCRPEGLFFDEDSALCTVMELYSCDLRKLIDGELRFVCGNPTFIGFVAPFMIGQLAMGLKGLHNLGIYHRDLKAENILVRKRPAILGCNLPFHGVVIADFESSEDIVGTAFWRAPEVLGALGNRTRLSEINWQAADVYSFGMVCYEILTGEIPFSGRRFCDYDGIISHGERPVLPDHVPGPLKDIILGCWHSDPNCRPDFTDILESLKQSNGLVNMFMGSMSRMLRGMESGQLNVLQLKEEIISEIGAFDDEAKARLMTLFAPIIENMESGFVGYADGGTPESSLLQLKKIAAFHMEINAEAKAGQTNYAYWASKYAATLDQFISEFGWKSITLPSFLPFSEYVELQRLSVLLTQQSAEFFHTCEEAINVYQANALRYDDFNYYYQLPILVSSFINLHMKILKGFEHCQLEEHDDVPLREKLTIVEASMESLLDEEVKQNLLLLSLGDLILQMDPEHTCTNPEIQKFHMEMRFMICARPYYLCACACAKYFRETVLEIIILYLIYRALIFSGCNYVLSYFGCGLPGFHEMFFGIEWVASRMGPRKGGFLFQTFTLYSLYANHGWKRCLTWFVIGYGGGWLQVIIPMLHSWVTADSEARKLKRE